ASAIAFWRGEEALLAIAGEVHAIKGLGANPSAQIDELVSSDAVGLLSSPKVVADDRAFGGRADSLSPFVMAAEEAAEANRARRQVFHGVNEVFAPILGIVVPTGLDGAIGHAKGLHELHIKPRRYCEFRLRIDNNRCWRLSGRDRRQCCHSSAEQQI